MPSGLESTTFFFDVSARPDDEDQDVDGRAGEVLPPLRRPRKLDADHKHLQR